MRRRRALALAIASGLAGCAPFGGPELPPVRLGVIAPVLADLPRAASGRGVLLVHAPSVRPMFDTPQMAYTREPQRLAYYRDHQWAETPGQMLHSLLVDALRASGAFASVVRPPQATAIAYALRVEVVELLQDFTAQPPVLRLALHAEVLDVANRRLLAARDVVVRDPLGEPTAAGGIAAANRAAARAMGETVDFVLAATAR